MIRDSLSAGVEEKLFTVSGLKSDATVVRSVLCLPEHTRLSPTKSCVLDISGRKVLNLHPGANDVSRLSPGVCFVREQRAVGVRRVVITKQVGRLGTTPVRWD